MRSSIRWEDLKYYSLTDEEIKQLWKKNGEEASAKGTAVHANIESFYNGMPHETDSKELELFISKFREDYPELKPYRSEWIIFDDDSKICGSIDMIYTTRREGL
ncbi:unnamed protein product [Pylaiella littoralis]